MKTFRFELSCFQGFYNTVWTPSEETIAESLDEKGVTLRKEWGFNFQDWQKDICEFYTTKYSELMQDELGISNELKNISLSSPRYYNFENDRLFADLIVPNLNKFYTKVQMLMQEHKVYLSEVIRRDFTSRDGFISFLPNSFDEWFADIQNPRILSQTIGYLLTAKVRQSWDIDYVDHLIHDDMEIYEEHYMYPETEEAKEEYERLLETEAERAWDREHLLELPFAWE